jgi:chromatin modification-related protein VID21
MMAQRQGQPNPNVNGLQPGLPNGVPQQRPALLNGATPNGANIAAGQNLAVPGQNRPRGPMAPPMGGQVPMSNALRMPMMNSVPQAPMQGMQAPMQLPLDAGLVNQAQHLAAQQRQQISMQQSGQLQPPGRPQNSPPRNVNGMVAPGFPQIPNGNMMPFGNQNGNIASPGAGPSPQGQAGSPRMNQPMMIPQVASLKEQIMKQFPTMPPDQVNRLAAEHMNKIAAQRSAAQSAMNAAAGAGASGMRMQPGSEQHTPQMYAQMMRQQQQDQQQKAQQANQQATNAVPGHQRTPSGNSAK